LFRYDVLGGYRVESHHTLPGALEVEGYGLNEG